MLKSALKVNMDEQGFVVPTGCLLHIPPKVVHTAIATDDGDAVYLICGDGPRETVIFGWSMRARER